MGGMEARGAGDTLVVNKEATMDTALRAALEAARHELVTLHGLYATDQPNAYAEASEDGADPHGAAETLIGTLHQIDAAAVIRQIDAALQQGERRQSMKYRKRPVVIDAEQWKPGAKIDGVTEIHVAGGFGSYAEVHTLEGVMRVSEGDWIITGVKGEKYPCKPDIFEVTYEPA